MTLARSTTWSPGDLLVSADLNGEFNNILNNPISLISPTTGAINFNLSSHRSLVPAAITATSGTAGQAIIVSGTEAVWGAPTVATSNLSIVTGSTGQVLAVTSSNSAPAFQVIPPDGGLSTTVPSTGMVYFVSTDAKVVGLAIGTSGQVLTVSTASKPSWETPAASGGGGGGAPSTSADIVFYRDDFVTMYSSTIPAGYITTTSSRTGQIQGSPDNPPWADRALGTATIGLAHQNPLSGGAMVTYSSQTGTANTIQLVPPASVTPGSSFGVSATQHYAITARFRAHSTAAGPVLFGVGTTAATVRTSAAATPGVYFYFGSSGPTNVFVLSFTSSAAIGSVDLGVTATAMRTYGITVTSSAIVGSVSGTAIGTITSSVISTSVFVPEISILPTIADGTGIIIDYLNIETTATNRV